MPVVEAASPSDAELPASSSAPRLVIAAVAIMLIGAGYWMFFRPSTAAPPANAPISADAPAPAAAPAASGTPSPAARAWDAAANAKEGPTAAAPEVTPVVPPSTPAATSIEEMVDRVMPAVVLIETTSGRGSGFFVRHDTLITNVHVVQNDVYVTLRRMDGSTISARVDKRAPAFDIAILKVTQPSSSQPVIPIGSAQSLKPGQEIVVIGSALGTLQNSVSRGIVSGLRTSGGATLVQTDAATNPGNSGGPMLDRSGAVIGITTMGYKNAEGLNFGVAIDHARDLLEGRETNLGSQRGLSEIQSQSRGSESDRRQQQGEEQFRGRIGELAATAADIDAGWQRFREQCYRSPIGGSYDREWFAMLSQRGMPANAGAGCTSYYKTMQSDLQRFHELMRTAVQDARRANLLPGTIRDVLRRHKLDFDWEK